MIGLNHFFFTAQYWFNVHREGPNGEPPPPIWSADRLLFLLNLLYHLLALAGLITFCLSTVLFYLGIKCRWQYASSTIHFPARVTQVQTTPPSKNAWVAPTMVFEVNDDTPIDKISPERLMYWSPSEKIYGRDELTSLARIRRWMQWISSMGNNSKPVVAHQQQIFHAYKALLETRPLFIDSKYAGAPDEWIGKVIELRVGSDGEVYTGWRGPLLYICLIVLGCILLAMKGVSILRDRAWNRSCWSFANGRIPTYWKRKNGLWVPIDKNNPKSFGYNNVQSFWRYSNPIFKKGSYHVMANPEIPLPPYRKVIPDPEPREPSPPAE